MTLHTKATRHTPRRAFTLMEMLIVVAIIVILAGVGTFYILPQFNKAKEDTAKLRAYSVEKAITTYMTNGNGAPGSLDVLTQKDAAGHGPYLEAEGILDPWGNVYQFDPTGNKFHNGAKPSVWTNTPDGRTVGNFTSQ